MFKINEKGVTTLNDICIALASHKTSILGLILFSR